MNSQLRNFLPSSGRGLAPHLRASFSKAHFAMLRLFNLIWLQTAPVSSDA